MTDLTLAVMGVHTDAAPASSPRVMVREGDYVRRVPLLMVDPPAAEPVPVADTCPDCLAQVLPANMAEHRKRDAAIKVKLKLL